jgi:transcriptional regulator with XRE-family HTH domain
MSIAMTDFRGRVGARIRRARLRKGLTQTELARRIDTADAQISRWENGRAFPSLGTLEAIADALDVSIESFFVDPPGSGPHMQTLVG